MKNIFLLCLLTLCFFTCDNEDDTSNVLTGIQVRVMNNGDLDLAGVNLRFNWNGASEEYHHYGSVAVGETSAYSEYDFAGLCSVDFFAVLPQTNDTLSTASLCLCICEMEEGFYTLDVSNFENNGNLGISATIREE